MTELSGQDLSDLASLKQRVTGTANWRKVQRLAKVGVSATEQAGDHVALRPRGGKGRALKVRCSSPMGVVDAVAWQACLDGDVRLLQEALERQANPNFRGPTYDGGTLMHAACAGGRVRCARVLLEHSADSCAKDRLGRLPLDCLQSRPELRHMKRLLQDVVRQQEWVERDDKNKAETKYRARLDSEAGDALKGWIIKLTGKDSKPRAAVATDANGYNKFMVTDYQVTNQIVGHQQRSLLFAVWNQALVQSHRGLSSSPRIRTNDEYRTSQQQRFETPTWSPHPTEETITFSDTLSYELVRRATIAELDAAGVGKGLGFEMGVEESGGVSVRFSGVQRNQGVTTYHFDVCIGETVIHNFGNRYSLLEKSYGKRYKQYAKFPPKQNKLWAKTSDSGRDSAEATRKAVTNPSKSRYS